MPGFIVITLFVFSFALPALTAIVVWSRRPQTLEGLTVAMTLVPTVAVGVHIAFALWLLPQYTINENLMVPLGLVWFFVGVGTVMTAVGLWEHALERIRREENERLKAGLISRVTPIHRNRRVS